MVANATKPSVLPVNNRAIHSAETTKNTSHLKVFACPDVTRPIPAPRCMAAVGETPEHLPF